MRRMKYRTLAAAALVAIAAALPIAQAKLDPAINDKIRQEESAHSQIMRTMHFLADVYGPRLTGSPNHKAAAEWAVKQMTEWGFANGHLEPWDFGHPGWTNERVEARIVSPMKAALVVQPLAWTPGTKGAVTAKAFNLVAPQGPEVPQADGARAAAAAGRSDLGRPRLN
jgi:carboxypeptidase Q